jgi:hypothetical protein
MSQLLNFIESLESKIKDFESRVQQSIMNHNALLGMLQASKEALAEAQKLCGDAALVSSSFKDLNLDGEVVNVVENGLNENHSNDDVPQ